MQLRTRGTTAPQHPPQVRLAWLSRRAATETRGADHLPPVSPLGPALSRSPPLSPSHAPISTTNLPSGAADEDVDFDDLQSPTPRPPGHTHSTSTSSLGSYTVPLSPGQGGFPTEAALLAARDPSSPKAIATSPTRPPNIQRTSKIRFAPLPEIRPRAYSTGRNVWIVEEDDPDVAGGRRQRLVRVEGEGEYGDDDDQDYGGDADFAEFDDDHALGQAAHSPSSSLSMKFGSWSEALGLSPSASRRSTDEDGLSLSSSVSRSDDGLSTSVGSVGSGGSSKKLLKAFGLGGKSAKSAAKRSSGTRDKENRDDSLSRTSSGDSHASAGRRASLADASRLPKPQGTTGIPMRKSSTWEVGDVASPTGPEIAASAGGPVYYASPARTARKRAQYPPVAQRRNGRGRKQHVEVEEPAFEEWGAAGVGSQSSKRVVVGSAPASGFDDDDDGTGMAWLRKRRLQREQEQREREAAALAQVAEDRTDEPATVVPVPEPPPAAVEDNQDTLTKDPRRLGSLDEEGDKRLPLPFLIRTPPSRSGTVDSTVSTASTVRPASPTHAAAKPSGLSATRPILPPTVQLADEPEREDSSSDDDDDDEEEEDALVAVGAAARPTEEEDETALESESGESDSESDDDDLDEDELAHEEALAEEARRRAKSMGKPAARSQLSLCLRLTLTASCPQALSGITRLDTRISSRFSTREETFHPSFHITASLICRR